MCVNKMKEVYAVVQQEAPGLTESKDLFDTSAIGKLPVEYHMRLDNTVHPTGSLGRGFRGRAPGPWGSGEARPRGPRLAPIGPPRGRGRPTVAVLAAV
ncbi:unnamed protein product [Boreogadus saida]